MSESQLAYTKNSKFDNSIVAISLLGIGAYLALHYGFQIGDETYQFSINLAITSSTSTINQ